jgi:hypothetical protein
MDKNNPFCAAVILPSDCLSVNAFSTMVAIPKNPDSTIVHKCRTQNQLLGQPLNEDWGDSMARFRYRTSTSKFETAEEAVMFGEAELLRVFTPDNSVNIESKIPIYTIPV